MTLGRSQRVSQILIADTQVLFRRGLKTLLSSEPDFQVLGEASDAIEALAKARLLAPDVLLMDIALAEGEGQKSIFAIRQACPSISILFLTPHDGEEQLQLTVSAGARAYMLKDTPPAQLLAGIRHIAFSDDRGLQGISRVAPDLQALASSSQQYGRGPALTSREQEVMRLLAEGRTVREVASELTLSIKTVEAHKLNLMRKLDIHNRASLVEYAVQKGMIPAPVL